MNPILSASVLGGLCAIDNRTSLNLMFSQPICGGFLTGVVLGAPLEGFLAGAFLQMMVLGFVPIRGETKPDLPLGGVTAAALAILVAREFGEDPALKGIILALSLLAALSVSILGSALYSVLRIMHTG